MENDWWIYDKIIFKRKLNLSYLPEVQIGRATFVEISRFVVARTAVETDIFPFIPAKGPWENRLKAGHQIKYRQRHQGAIISHHWENGNGHAVPNAWKNGRGWEKLRFSTFPHCFGQKWRRIIVNIFPIFDIYSLKNLLLCIEIVIL